MGLFRNEYAIRRPHFIEMNDPIERTQGVRGEGFVQAVSYHKHLLGNGSGVEQIDAVPGGTLPLHQSKLKVGVYP